MKKRTKDEMITEWLKLEQARLTARGVETLIVTHPTRTDHSALKRVTVEGKRHG